MDTHANTHTHTHNTHTHLYNNYKHIIIHMAALTYVIMILCILSFTLTELDGHVCAWIVKDLNLITLLVGMNGLY